MVTMLSMTSRRDTNSTFSVIFPLSILDISSTSLIRASRWLEERVTFFRQSATLASLPMFCAAMALMPMMP